MTNGSAEPMDGVNHHHLSNCFCCLLFDQLAVGKLLIKEAGPGCHPLATPWWSDEHENPAITW